MTDQQFDFPEFEGHEPTPRTQPVGFKLNGRSFKCVDELPGGVWRHITDDNITTQAAIAFIEGAIEDPTDTMAFRAMIDAKDIITDGPVIGRIMLNLVGQYGKRPTTPSSDASGGTDATTDGSQGGALTVVSDQ